MSQAHSKKFDEGLDRFLPPKGSRIPQLLVLQSLTRLEGESIVPKRVPFGDVPAWESGQFIVDKARHWKPLALADWINDHSDYVYRHIYGDKDTYHLAWRKLGYEVCVPTSEPGWESIAFVQKDFGGRPLFIHCTRDKFRWHGEVDGQNVPRHYMTEHWHPTNPFVPGLPHEQVAYDFCRESSDLLRPETHFACRPKTCNRGIFIEVRLQKEYRLPPRFEPDGLLRTRQFAR